MPALKTPYTKSQLLTATASLEKYTTPIPQSSYSAAPSLPSALGDQLAQWWTPPASTKRPSRLLVALGTWDPKDKTMLHLTQHVAAQARKDGLPLVAHFGSEEDSEAEAQRDREISEEADAGGGRYEDTLESAVAETLCKLVFSLVWQVVRVLPDEKEEDGGEKEFEMQGEWSADIFEMLEGIVRSKPLDAADAALAMLWAAWQVAPRDLVCVLEGFDMVLAVVEGLRTEELIGRLIGIVGKTSPGGKRERENRTLITTDSKYGGFLEKDYADGLFSTEKNKEEEKKKGLAASLKAMSLESRKK